MKLAICLSLLVGLVAVYAQEEQIPACKNGKRTVSECDGEEFTITIEGEDCLTLVRRTGKCVADSAGNMVPVTSVFKRLECFYTLPDMSGICDPETNKLVISKTLVSGNVEECEETIETTVQCSENDDGELVPNRAEMKNPRTPSGGKGPDSERPDAPPRRGGRGGRLSGKGQMRSTRGQGNAEDDGGEGNEPRARRPPPGEGDGGNGSEPGPRRGDGGKGNGPSARRAPPGEGRRRGARSVDGGNDNGHSRG